MAHTRVRKIFPGRITRVTKLNIPASDSSSCVLNFTLANQVSSIRRIFPLRFSVTDSVSSRESNPTPRKIISSTSMSVLSLKGMSKIPNVKSVFCDETTLRSFPALICRKSSR